MASEYHEVQRAQKPTDGFLETRINKIGDVVFLSPGRAPCGRDGFSPQFSAAHQQARINCISELKELVVVGEVAYTLSQDSLSVTPRAGGESMRFAGDRMTVYRKQPDGRWILSRDAHTLSPAAKQGS